MTAFLIVDVDDLLQRLETRGVALDIHTVAAALLNSAALAAGLGSPEDLVAVAVADWNRYRRPSGSAGVSVQQVFASEGYDLFNVPDRKFVTDALLMHYFSFDTESVDELIIATSQLDISTLVHRVQTTDRARVRIWGDEPPPDLEGVIFQPLESILGIPSKTVALYIDFENISISLSEQGYILDIDILLEGMLRQAQTHGQVIHMAAYAPWGQRGSLAPADRPDRARSLRRSAQPPGAGQHRPGVQPAGQEQRRHAHRQGSARRQRQARQRRCVHHRQRRPRLQRGLQRRAGAQQAGHRVGRARQHQPPGRIQPRPGRGIRRGFLQPRAARGRPGRGEHHQRAPRRGRPDGAGVPPVAVVERDPPARPDAQRGRHRRRGPRCPDRPADRRAGGAELRPRRRPDHPVGGPRAAADRSQSGRSAARTTPARSSRRRC